MPSPTNYLIAHGTENGPDGNWFPWLKQQLEMKGGKVFAPQFPTPDNQNLSAWFSVAEQELQEIDPADTILIGHSTGSVFVLRMAEKTPQPYKAIFSVCPFACDLGLPDYDTLNTSFIHPPFDWKRTERGAKKIVCFAGDDDPYVPLAYSQDVADSLGITLNILKNSGHLNAESGYRQFPLLLEKIYER